MSDPTPLHYVWDYRQVDRDFWDEHLEGWLPGRIIDAHSHVAKSSFRLEPMTEAKRKQFWVSEVSEAIEAPDVERCQRIVFPGRDVDNVVMGHPSVDYDIDASNGYISNGCAARGWYGLALLRPEWSVERVAAEIAKPGIIGVKPYYSMIAPSANAREKLIESSIFEFLPHATLALLNDRRAWVTLHVPKADRLGHPDNIREVKEIRRRYPDIVLVIAHFGRCYTEPHAAEALPQLADDDGLYFDNSATLNPATHRIALECFGPGRILYGTDNPVFYMRGRRQWRGREYINRTNHPFHFNKERESPEIEATYTLTMYEALKAIKDVCEAAGSAPDDVEAILHGNARRLIDSVLEAKKRW